MAGTKVLLDSGPLVAYLNRKDQWHEWATACWSELFEPMATCDSVLSEATFLLQEAGLSVAPLLSLFERQTIELEFDLEEQFADVARLMRKYEDLPMSLADACLVRMAESADDCQVFTTDKDFRVYRRHGRGLIPLMAPFEA
jgi:predicted nucleic acid-binding protein